MITVGYIVAKGKTELSRRTVSIDDATVASIVEGEASQANEADVVFTLTPDLAASVAAGELSVGAGFMRGSIKMAGDFAALLEVLPILHHNACL